VKVAILGAGAWGTALGLVLDRGGHEIVLWGHNPEHLQRIRQTGRNEPHLPGIDLPPSWTLEPNLARAVADVPVVVMAVPSKALRTVAAGLANLTGLVVSVTKGIEHESGLTMCGVLRQCAPRATVAALSGPSLALEVARGIPTAIVAASPDAHAAQTVQRLFHHPSFRVYTSPDLVGVEMGGALKNVVAIAAGVGDGLGFGDNSKAALVTRGIVEIRRLGVACGAHPDTFAGLSGLGDLTVTCFSRLSRNRTLGEQLGRGEKLADILARSVTIAEGYPTSRSAWQLARTRQVSTPIIDEVYQILYEGKDVSQALQDLTRRESKPE
jgi:glycerol-3-phosphate dehydrogenase (NAD(P)+)